MCAQNDSRLLHHNLAYLNSTIGHCLLDDHDTTSWCIDASAVQVEELGANYLAIAEWSYDTSSLRFSTVLAVVGQIPVAPNTPVATDGSSLLQTNAYLAFCIGLEGDGSSQIVAFREHLGSCSHAVAGTLTCSTLTVLGNRIGTCPYPLPVVVV